MGKGAVSDKRNAGSWWNAGPKGAQVKLSPDRILLTRYSASAGVTILAGEIGPSEDSLAVHSTTHKGPGEFTVIHTSVRTREQITGF